MRFSYDILSHQESAVNPGTMVCVMRSGWNNRGDARAFVELAKAWVAANGGVSRVVSFKPDYYSNGNHAGWLVKLAYRVAA